MENPAKKNKKSLKVFSGAAIAVLVVFVTLLIVRVQQHKSPDCMDIADKEAAVLNQLLKTEYPDRYSLLQNLPYKISEPDLNVYAGSAILIDEATGVVLYSKNADEVIPPASMTKLFAMFVVDEEVSAGHLSYDQIIPLPPECWACNMPPHSSLMFLGEGQVVTLEELLLGLSICSGNDAAYALAYAVCGNMEDFVSRMNKVAADLGLEHTHFEEASGYSEKNTTTAREMAAFARYYLMRHPESLEKFHSVKSFTYPKEKNMAPGDYVQAQDWSNGLTQHITMSITQSNTNPLLGKLEGCDGLKTGYIDESGYNLSLTAIRHNTRFLSVTMKGPGASAAEGQAGRVHDGTELMEWAFGSFADYYSKELTSPYFIKVYGAKEFNVQLMPACDSDYFCVPYVTGDSMADNLSEVKITYEVPPYIFGEVEAGKVYGSLKVELGGYVLDSIPLVAARNVKKAGFVIRGIDYIIK